MTVADTTTIFLPIAYVRDREFLHKRAQVPVALRPKHKMPMIRQQAIRADTHGAGLERPFDRPLKRLEVGLLQKQTHPTHASVQDMEDHSTRSYSGDAWHDQSLAKRMPNVNN